MLRIILGIVLIAVISGLGNLLLSCMLSAPRKSKYGCAKVRPLYPIVGLGCVILSAGTIYIMLSSHRSRLNFGLTPVFLVIFFAGMVMIWQWISQRIWYDEASFAVRNFWMIKRKYAYKDITGIFRTSHVYIIVGKTKISIDSSIAGGDKFVRAAIKGYAKANNGEEIPRARRLPRDAFNGNIADSDGYIVIGILLLAFFGGMLLSFYVRPSEITSEHFEAPMENASVGTEDMTFYLTSQEEPFVIEDFRNYAQNIDMLWETVSKSQKLSVYAEYKPGHRTASGHYQVYSMSDENGNVYVTFDMTWQQERGVRMSLTIACGGLLVLMVIYGVACVIASRNPEKHKLLYKLCFSKKGKRR